MINTYLHKISWPFVILLHKIDAAFFTKTRLRRIVAEFARLAPLHPGSKVNILDIGAGDCQFAFLLTKARPDIEISCIDIIVKDKTYLPLRKFDGKSLPYLDKSFDGVIFVNVLHHIPEGTAIALLREAVRVSREFIIIKDHIFGNKFDKILLRFMDRIGNINIDEAYNYWPKQRWLDVFSELGLQIDCLSQDLNQYGFLVNSFFGRRLHIIAKLSFNK